MSDFYSVFDLVRGKPRPSGRGVCQKQFATTANRQRHQAFHSEDQPWTCPVEGCGKRYKNQGDKDIHLLTHTGERPWLSSPRPGAASLAWVSSSGEEETQLWSWLSDILEGQADPQSSALS
ncbi:MAG: hypothetical protein OXC07_12410 [Kistimonas sp.]|nr:hypothetical protein [Kistimonas sp.]